MKQATYFLTGASSGLGLALAQDLVERGDRVICTGGRDAAVLPPTFPDCPYLACDLSTSQGAMRARDWALQQSGGKLNGTILNAGTGHYRPLSGETVADITQTLGTNLDANMLLAQGLCPALRGGRLGLIGSVAHKGAANMPIYAASKGALDGFGRALAEEWRGQIVVRVLHPGPVATGMSERAGRPRDRLNAIFLPPRATARTLLRALEARRGADRQVISYLRVGISALSAKPRRASA